MNWKAKFAWLVDVPGKVSTIFPAIVSAIAILVLPATMALADAREIEWLDLMPQSEADAWLNDQGNIDHSGFGPVDAFQSWTTVGELDGQQVR
ncbi:MAG: hypothetical protein ACNA7E_10060, partial [Wenzhouxiangellaceae bacterium]